MEIGNHAMTKKVIYDNGQRAPLFLLRCSLEKNLDPQPESDLEITCHNFYNFTNSTVLSLGIRHSNITVCSQVEDARRLFNIASNDLQFWYD